MPAETGRPYRPLSSLPIAFGFFTIIALAVILLHSPSDQINRLIETYNDAGHSALSLERDDSYSNHTLFRRRDQYSCTKDIPCETEACCGSFFDGVGTCGFGGAFCGSDCTSQCDAKPECGQYADPPGKKCPLNVCCSKYGFCGTQDDYCDASKGCQSNCGTPSIPAGKSSKPVTNRVIGYYEAWAARRECYPFPPAAIPIQGLTHLNLAFAYIDPKSFEIVPMDSLTPSSLFTQTADVRSFKSGLSDLQVYISLGGWTFSDNHTATQPTFGEIASTEANRRKFANNLVHFMRKYGFDGVDLDWEYPGAPDRGGKKEDVKNFVLLMKTLKQTFMHSSRGSYGLTFTIPSSYWYLKWFDMPGLLKYADWTNVMTYDLHGVWDKHNPIGDIVQSHTNLTEIKKSMELLWRNDVPPEKVVFGLGFYGRSFTLNSKSCSKPGCQFAGASKKGACTKSAGTLAYFEIQDIIAEEKPKIIHDKEAAAKYFTFSRDQWVSFDDKETFKQKIDWANKVGLGGVMIWSVDQDDKKFTALKGLLGKSLQDYDALMSRAEKTDTGKWASLNGQKCIMTSCGTPPECPSGYGLAPNGGNFQDNCGKSSYKVVCCPLDSMPSSCLWRGGERSVGRPSCHGQCHTGEVTLFHSRHATKNCLRPGFQAFCCSANTWTKQIDSCHYTECGEKCSGATTKVAQKRGGNCWFGKTQELCCPEDAAFQNCHWVGKGTCDDNECSDTDVQLDLDTYGDDAGSCVGNNRKKVLCCNTPKSLNPFLPVSLDKVFPTLPNEDYYPQFDLQNLGGEAASQKLDYNTFGLIIIVGPEESVQSMRKRDGADAHVLDCESIKPEGRSTIRMVCEEGRNSTCDKIHIGGVEGTVLRMPDGCGPGSYSVLHSVRPASNRDVPHHIARSVSEGYDVLEAEVSFDFGLVKRDAGEIYVRIDYSNSAEYWKSIVQGEPSKSKRSKRSKRSAAPLDKRFYSSGAADWADKFDKLRQASEYQDELYIDRLGLGSIDKHNFNALLGGEVVGNCSSKSDDGFLNMGLSGQLHEALEFGFSFVGTISPKFKMEEAYGYYDTNIQVDGTFAFDGKGSLDISEEVAPAKLFSSPVSAWGFSHPGICNFGPQVDISVELAGHGDIDGDFKAKFIIGNEGVMTDSLPVSTGGHAGGLSSIDASDSFTGSLSLPASKSTPPKNQKRKFSGLGDTVLALNFVTNSQMILELDFYGREQAAAEVQFNQTVHSLFRIARQDDGTPRVEFSNQKGFIESFTRGELPWGDDENQYALKGGETLVLSEKASKPKDRDAPEPDGSGLFDGHDIMSCSGGGRRSGQGKCFCPSGLVKYDRTLHFNPDEGQTSQRRRQRRVAENGHRHGHRRHLHMSSLRAFDSSLDLNPDTGRAWAEDLEVEYLESRAIHYGRAEDYPIRRPNRGGGWTVPFRRYPNGQNGDSLLQLNPNAGRYGAADCYDCGDTGISSNSDDPDMNVVTEHIQERQTEPRAQEFMMNGETQRRDGAPVRSRYPIIDRDYLDPNSFLFRDYSQWDPNGPYTGRPIDEITNAYGSDTNPGVLVNTDSVLNGYKARVWVGSQAMGDDLWDSNGFHQPDSELAGAAIATIRTTIQVISYLNDDEVNRAWSTVINTVVAAYGRYQERVLAVTGVQINPREMYQEYMNEVVIRNIENSIESWVYRRIGQLRRVWEPLRGIDPEAEGILQDLRRLERTMRDEFIDTSRMDIT